MKASEWRKTLPAMATAAQAAIVAAAIDASMRLPIDWVGIPIEANGHTGVLFVMADALKIGEPGDSVRVNVSTASAQAICDALGLQMPTAKMADIVRRNVEVWVPPQNYTVTKRGVEVAKDEFVPMSSVAAMFGHDANVTKGVNGRFGIVCNPGKLWLIGSTLGPVHPQGGWLCLNYGWYLDTAPSLSATGGYRMWQPVSSHHNDSHVDYSQVFWAVHPMMIVDGQVMPVADVLRNPELAPLISHEGALPFARHPRIPPSTMTIDSIAPPIDQIRMVGAEQGSATSGGWLKALVVAGLLAGIYYASRWGQ